MRHLFLICGSSLALLLTACGAGSSDGDGGRPTLPTSITVQHPAAAAHSYLLLLNEAGTSVYQQSITAGAIITAVQETPWTSSKPQTRAIAEHVPANTSYLNTDPQTGVAFHEWAIWHDRNADGERAEDELLPLMTHDRVAYAEVPVILSFGLSDPKMQQHWNLRSGWSRAEHYVYLPKGSDTYRRLFNSAVSEQYQLHVPTPITSQ